MGHRLNAAGRSDDAQPPLRAASRTGPAAGAPDGVADGMGRSGRNAKGRRMPVTPVRRRGRDGARRGAGVWGELRRWLAVGLTVAFCLALMAGLVRTALFALYPFPFRATIETQAAQAGVDPLLVVAVMRSESKFDVHSVSPRGALGLMQVEPATGSWIAGQLGDRDFNPQRLFEPRVNIAYGTWYLGLLKRQFAGRTPAAVAAYNAGIGRVQGWLASGRWSGSTADLRRIPYPETRNFVSRVLSDWRVYQLLYQSRQAGAPRAPAGSKGDHGAA